MQQISQQLFKIVHTAFPKLQSITEEQASHKPLPEKWSPKEILGHMIDSASNNHQRIVRMQEVEHIGTFRYSQDHWVHVQQYQQESWQHILSLWYAYNLHLAHIMAHISAEALSHTCDVGKPEPVPLEFIVADYVRHIEHHLEQLFNRIAE
ncbi:MAG TPA: DinB family protein [Bacteroidota bacterium]|nr:DinB family protein [Bacteroidota bacterium]